MAKSTINYWNPLINENKEHWLAIEGLEGVAEELTLSIDPDSAEYTRLTCFILVLIPKHLVQKATRTQKEYL